MTEKNHSALYPPNSPQQTGKRSVERRRMKIEAGDTGYRVIGCL